jgi:hypothetical protein
MKIQHRESGNTLIIAVLTTALFGTLVGIAVDYTTNVGRNAQRSLSIAKAVEIGDGSLELAFASWRKICSSQEDPTAPMTKTSFATITAPAGANFPIVESGFTLSRTDQGSNPTSTISNFKVEPVDPLLGALPSSSPAPTPTKSTGPGEGTFSYFYLASADVTVKALKGSITAKVRRVFEQRITSPWNWAIMFNDNLELSPDSNLTLNGWVHTNGQLYTPSSNLTLTDRLSYVSDWNFGWDPSDTYHFGMVPGMPAYNSEFPPGTEQPYIPFGWDPSTLINTTDTLTNNDSYREVIERPASPAETDAWADTRFYNQAAIVIEINAANVLKVYTGVAGSRSDATGSTDSGTKGTAWSAAQDAISVNHNIMDYRRTTGAHPGPVRMVEFDMDDFRDWYPTTSTKAWNGIIYIVDTSAGVGAKRGIKIVNAHRVPNGGITIASENPVYIEGDFNTGDSPPSNSGDPTDSTGSGYTKQPCLIAADAVMLMSNNWDNSKHDRPLAERIPTNTTVNSAIIAGNVPTNSTGTGDYSGGAENFVRFMEDWQANGRTFTYYGSMIQFFRSVQATEPWGTNPSMAYSPPSLKWYFDKDLTTKSPPSTVKSQMATVSYLQQQRWFVTFQPNS